MTFHYFDRAGLTLSLQYDSTTAAYQNGPALTTAGTNTWKAHTVILRDTHFRNRQNGGADFRIAAPPGVTFDVDLEKQATTLLPSVTVRLLRPGIP